SVRYLERRIALCGGELAALFSDDAIDEIVRRSEGCLTGLEEVADGALRRAAKRGSKRVVAEDVLATVPRAIAEENRVMANRQQPMDFRISDDADMPDDEWTVTEDEASAEWQVDAELDAEDDEQDEEEDELWQADGEQEEEESALSWDSAPRLEREPQRAA